MKRAALLSAPWPSSMNVKRNAANGTSIVWYDEKTSFPVMFKGIKNFTWCPIYENGAEVKCHDVRPFECFPFYGANALSFISFSYINLHSASSWPDFSSLKNLMEHPLLVQTSLWVPAPDLLIPIDFYFRKLLTIQHASSQFLLRLLHPENGYHHQWSTGNSFGSSNFNHYLSH